MIPSTQFSGDGKNISLQLEVDEGAESVDDDSSTDSCHDPASEEEDDIKQEPEDMDCTPQNGNSAYQKGGNHLSQATPVVKQEPTDNGEFGSSVTQSVETTQTKTVYHVGVVKQEPTDKGEYENSVSQSVATSERIVSHQHTPFVLSGAPASLSVLSSNTTASVKPSVVQGIPTTKTTALNPLGMGPQFLLNPVGSGPQTVFSIIPGGNVAQTVQNPAVVGAQTLFPVTPGLAQTINLPTSGNVASPQLFNVIRSGNSLILGNASASPSTVTPNLQNPSFTFAHPVGLNPQSNSNVHPTIPMAVNVSNVGQRGSVALQPMLVPVSGVEWSSKRQKVSTSSESPSVLDPGTTAVKQKTPSTNTHTGSHNRGAEDKQTDVGCKQMDEKISGSTSGTDFGPPQQSSGKARGSQGRSQPRGRGQGGKPPTRQQRREERLSELQAQVEGMAVEELRQLVVQICERHPSHILDIVHANSQMERRRGGYHPLPDEDSPDWCGCGKCREMPTEEEEVCCGQTAANCISTQPDFDFAIMDPLVLLIARRYRQDILALSEDEDMNRNNRHAAYRQFILWRHGHLGDGDGDHAAIPSCCVWKIRDKYPDRFGQYRPFVGGRLD